MTWVKLDDQFPDHPKVAGLTDGAFRLYVTGLCYSSRHRTDGEIPEALISRWGVRHSDRAASELMSAGLWTSAADHYEVHGYLEHQRSREQIEAISTKRAKAGSKGGKASAQAKQVADQEASNLEAKGDPEFRSQSSESDPSSSVLTIDTGLPPSSEDDDVWIEYGHLKAAASTTPIGAFSRWLPKVIADGQEAVGHKLTPARDRWPNASSEQLARYLFDGTEPPKPPKVHTCEDCSDSFVGLAAYQDHFDRCRPSTTPEEVA